MNGYKVENETIIINRDLTQLDIFLKDFLKVLKNYSGHLVVSGYVSICSGRTRATEDIDLLVPIMNKQKFGELFNDLQKDNFWCYQGDDAEEVYQYLKNFVSIRFARINETFPNIEFIPINETKKTNWF